ncbi:nickel ABC transporter permease [Acetonema longum]|uniref:Nickel import system permease protein NikB n=1 Tax=Acetonema longum DSM 6540 TaxID=1009370 RepID=F7NJB6_9FIRM|nr:nickel ABC transporter permease [Acetonema longum]EGO63864.1 glutathione ABC transporter [Acetonema longum DSM 6540]
MLKRQLLKRLLQIGIVLLGISFLSFLLIYLAPGDPVRAMFAVTGNIPPEEILEDMREQMGLNRPFLVQYVNWLMNCLHGDFGTSYSQGKPVSQMLAVRVLPTLQLAFLSLVMMMVMAIPAGVLSALHQNRFLDYFIRGVTFFGISLPNFWAGLLLIYFVALKLGLLPVVSTGMGLQKMILPAFTLAFAMAGKYARQVRAAILEEMSQDYVYGALARGLSEAVVLWRHIIPNAMLPLLTLLGLSLGSLLGGTAVVEVIFSYPALGSLAINAITSMDYPLIQGYVLWIALIYMIVNLAVDVSYGFLDPRLKKGV